jgi:hypothetical protein
LHSCNVRLWPKADIPHCTAHVRFRGQSGHNLLRCMGPLLTQSGPEPPLQGASLRRYDNAFGAVGAAIRRRDFMKILAGSAVSWPLATHAQQSERLRRVGVLMNLAAEDPEGQVRLKAFIQGLQKQGWIEGRNMRVDMCWGAGKPERPVSWPLATHAQQSERLRRVGVAHVRS